MSEKCKKLLAKYVISILVSLAVIVFVLYNRGFFATSETKNRILYLADAFTIPGVVILMVGVMTWLSSAFGLFDGLTYSLGRLARSLIPGGNLSDEKFYDYKQRKMESRKTDYAFLFIVGGSLLLIAIVFTVVHSFI